MRLPEAARRAGVEAVGVYHMVLEGVVFTAGQLALLELVDDRLPGLRAGTELVLRDERWHVGFGTRCLLDAGLDADAEAAILEEGERAAAVWAPEPGRAGHGDAAAAAEGGPVKLETRGDRRR